MKRKWRALYRNWKPVIALRRIEIEGRGQWIVKRSGDDASLFEDTNQGYARASAYYRSLVADLATHEAATRGGAQ